jgi:hypothetical protein
MTPLVGFVGVGDFEEVEVAGEGGIPQFFSVQYELSKMRSQF